MEVIGLLKELREGGFRVWVEDNKLRVNPGDELSPKQVEFIKANRDAIIDHLTSKPKLVEMQTPEWHSKEVARLVIEEGICIFWSEFDKEIVAFVRSDSLRSQVPAGIVVYTAEEIQRIWSGDRIMDSQRRLIHEAKKRGDAQVMEVLKDDRL
ncbi:MAG: hypothetical protein PHV74_15065 [Dehalococcoidia bacterium]|nr:hypothetical protein [Dehalococcoidia bacterium]